MSTITLPNIRVSSDLTVKVRLKDSGVAIDWSTLTKIKASIYSDAQRALAGRCDVSIDAEDSTLLVCNYAANKPQYVGVNRIVVSAKYMGETKTYDKPAFTFVRWTADQEGEQITIDDPDVDVEISVEDISSSILQEAVDAAFEAADRANDAAEAAEHMVDIHTGPEGKSAYEVAVEEGYVGTEEEWLASLVGPQGQQGIQGETGEAAGFGTVSVSLQEDGGQPSATVAASGTDTAKNFAFTFNNLKGEKGDKGDQGNSGYTGAAGELEVVNNLTDGGAAKALSAEMGKTLEGEVSQLEAVLGFEGEIDLSQLPVYQGLIAENAQGNTIWEVSTTSTCCFLPVNPGQTYTITANETANANYAFLKQAGVGTQYSTPDFASGYSGRVILPVGESATVDAPSDALVLYIRKTTNAGLDTLPTVSTKESGLKDEVAASTAHLHEIDLKIDGETIIDKGLVWSAGYVDGSTGKITASTASKFCQPVLLKAGEKLTYKTGSSFSRAVVEVSDATTVAVGDTLSGAVLINYSTANTTVEYTAVSDKYIVISILNDGSVVEFREFADNSINERLDNLKNETNKKVTQNQLLSITPDIYSTLESESITNFDTLSQAILTVDGLVSSGSGVQTIKYFQVAKGDRIHITAMASGTYRATYGISNAIPTIGATVSNIVNHAGGEDVDDIYVCSEGGYLAFYAIRNVTFAKIVGNFANIIKSQLYNKIPFTPQSGAVLATTGEDYSVASRLNTGYVDISGMSSIIYTRVITDGNGGHFGLAFYDANKDYISGVEEPTRQPNYGYVLHKVDVPSSAVYAKFTYWKDQKYGIFFFADGERDAEAISLYNANNLKLQIRTFNSSYNETDVKDKREDFCSLFRGTGLVESFLFFTDPHLSVRSRYETMTEEVRDKYISTLQKYYNSLPMDMCICGGDWLNSCDTYASACDELGYADSYMRKLFKGFFPVFGNHDDNPYDWGSTGTTHKLSFTEVRNLAFRENGNLFYSFDGINTKFYVLNNCGSSVYSMDSYKWSQIDWLANRLLQDNPAHAILLSHIFSNGLPSGASGSYPAWLDGVHKLSENAIKLAVAFNNRESITLNGITYDFSAMTGKVECYITGHLHADIVTTAFELPVITTTNLEGGGYADRINYQDHSYALVPTFDCCLADYENDKLRMVRVGAGVNRTVNLSAVPISVGGTTELSSIFSGTITWHSENTAIATVANGVVTGVAPGIGGIRAINEEGEEEYWIIKVS